jgi:uncharacterized protein (TIGR02246 family)
MKTFQRCVLFWGVLLLGACASVEPQSGLDGSVKRLIVERQITELISRYSHMWDSKNATGLADLFAEDGVWDRWGPGVQKPDISIKGRDNFRDWTANRFKTALADRQTRHYQTNTVFLEVTDDLVRTRTVFVVMQVLAADKTLRVATTGIYEDEFRRTSEGWRISHRVLRADN